MAHFSDKPGEASGSIPSELESTAFADSGMPTLTIDEESLARICSSPELTGHRIYFKLLETDVIVDLKDALTSFRETHRSDVLVEILNLRNAGSFDARYRDVALRCSREIDHLDQQIGDFAEGRPNLDSPNIYDLCHDFISKLESARSIYGGVYTDNTYEDYCDTSDAAYEYSDAYKGLREKNQNRVDELIKAFKDSCMKYFETMSSVI